jgi:hypothetical protein
MTLRWQAGRGGRRQPPRLRPGGRLDLLQDLQAKRVQALPEPCGRLGDEVAGAELQGTKRGIRAARRQGRDHDHRHRPERHHLFEKGEAVHMRHLDVQGQNVRIELLDQLARLQRILAGADHLHLAVALEELGEQLADQCGIVDDQGSYGSGHDGT